MPGSRGPVGKSDAERVRVEKPVVATERLDLSMMPTDVVVPRGDEGWHDLAKVMYAAHKNSLTAALYEPSDWAMLYLLCEQLSRQLKPQFVGMERVWNDEAHDFESIRAIEKIPMKGGDLSAIMSGFTRLLSTVGDRRRAAIEIARESGMKMAQVTPEGGVAGVTSLADRRRAAVSS